MELYINGIGVLSAAGISSKESFPIEILEKEVSHLTCQEPNYLDYIPPMQLRRMSKAVRMGIGAVKLCLADASIQKPDALSVGTALGCLHDTENFLSKMVEQNEQMLSPTAFIQSTHNTVAGQIALLTGSNGHNLTFAHRGHSFEHALLNAKLYLNQHANETVLVGGIDELTETSLHLLKELNVYEKTDRKPSDMFIHSTNGSIAGEGSSFFAISRTPSFQSLKIERLHTFHTLDINQAKEEIKQFLALVPKPDTVILGINGDVRTQEFYEELMDHHFSTIGCAGFKHFCGEYPVAGSFAIAMAVWATRKEMPQGAWLARPSKSVKQIVVVNHFLHHFSCWSLSAS
ncbi:MAG: beta-ketoacyl synthase chain length factor [Bacteroidetes bacterium]|nr:beta-ketoacyl synthase chain length factor [Bacteroidota bacterium]MBS1741345.1 beta-ketoacyl synthase chain length factor [Bacteroidota bacterium]